MPGACRLGVVIYIDHNHYIFIRYNPRAGIDIRFKFITLWTLLEIAIKNYIINLQVIRESKLVIDKERYTNVVEDIILAPIMRDIKLVFSIHNA